LNRFTGVVNLYILVGAGARVSENVAVDGNATTGFSVTPFINDSQGSGFHAIDTPVSNAFLIANGN